MLLLVLKVKGKIIKNSMKNIKINAKKIASKKGLGKKIITPSIFFPLNKNHPQFLSKNIGCEKMFIVI